MKLDFIKDPALRKTIEDSFLYIAAIFDQAKKSKYKLYREETFQVIILYVISITESILLYIFHSRGEKMKYNDYSYVHCLPAKFKYSDASGNPLVIAIQVRKEKSDYQIGLIELLNFMKDYVPKNIAVRIIRANEIRNTYHFLKPRDRIFFNVKTVERTLDLLVKVIEMSPKLITEN